MAVTSRGWGFPLVNMSIKLRPKGPKTFFVRPGARFSKAPETFRARKAIFSSTVPKNGEVWSSFADEHNTLPKSTRRNVKLNKFAFGTPWLPDLLFKRWFTSSVWNFCRWVTDVRLCETSLSGDERGETLAILRLRAEQLVQRKQFSLL